ncbi:protein MMS22-like [Phymastichus coffea]|uniref:protein MMS22-like n=1 Tax=Phymastichus coffea TaxID=108790 RepID=UPI00273CD17F|nr:protein MMS22-like [Phymastichus coffea]
MENFDPTFNCTGKVNINNWYINDSSFYKKKDLDIVLNNNKSCSNGIFSIFNYETTGISILLKLQHFSRCLDSRLKQFERYEKLNTINETFECHQTVSFYLLRKSTCEFVYYLRNYLKCLKSENFALKDISSDAESDFDDLVDTIIKFLNRLKNIPTSTFLYVSSTSGNSSKHPEYHLYHLHLDLRWLLITLLYVKNDQWDHLNEITDDLKNCIYDIIADLIYINMNIFESIPIVELQTKTPYSCTCMRELWLILQLLLDELSKKNVSKCFWNYFNSALNMLFFNNSMEEMPHIKQYGNFSDCKNPELFCIWLTYHLTLLYGYDTNGNYLNRPSNRYEEIQMILSKEQVDKILKAYVIKGGKEGERDEIDEELCVMIPLLQLLSINWGQSDFQLFALLWDCFHKRLDKPFLLQTRGPWLTSSEKKTPMDILNSVKDRLKNNNEASQESSFSLFLHLLGMFLKKNYSRTESKIWHQIKGRIFMKITRKKLEESTECGLYNFVSLCLTLAVTADTCDATISMLKVTPDVHKWTDADSAKKCCLLWKSQLAMLLLYHEKKIPLKEIATYFTKTADTLCCINEENSRSMMVWYIDVLRIILTQNNNFECDEHELLSGWIDRILSDTAPNRVGVLISTLLKVFLKCVQNRDFIGNLLMRNAILQHASGRVRTMITVNDLSNNLYENLTKLGVALTIEACKDNVTLKYGHSAAKLFVHYTTCPILNDMRVPKLYLNILLQNDLAIEFLKKEKEIKDFDLLCIQLWIKTNILTKEDNEDYFCFKNYVANIPVIKEIMSTDRDYYEFLQSNEPLAKFLLIVSKKRKTFQTEQEQMTFDNKCKSFLFGIEKWAVQLINNENKDSKLSTWIYQCIGLITKTWSQILYSKNASNMLKTLITKIALPLDQESLSCRIHLSQKIFSMIILGFENLNINVDISLQNLIRELFERYLSFLVIPTDSNERSFKLADQLSMCFFAKPDFTKSIFFILAKNLITLPQDQTTHSACYLVMHLLINLIKAGKTYSIEILDSIILECVPNILSCYCRVHDSHPHKKHTMDFLREITTSPYYQENVSLREKLKDLTWNVFKKTTIPQSKASFNLLSFTFKIDKELYKYLYTKMETLVCGCEKNQFSNAATLRFLLNSVKKI